VEQVALVSGANRGLGREAARQLAEQGVRVIVGSREPEAGVATAAEIGAGATARRLDVTDQGTVDDLLEWIAGELGRLDVLVNNAGIGGKHRPGGIEADLDAVKEVLETNLFGAWRLAEGAVALMRRHDYGRIVNVSSGMGQLTDMGGGNPGYRVSKTALNALTRIFAAELRGENILVNSVCPGWVRTDMGGANARRSVEEGADTIVWLATLPDGGPSGGFFRDRQPIPW
jgi:NAD(P)-dependent dehydrogenase (short-subunit alcohol dehydrogenase family)